MFHEKVIAYVFTLFDVRQGVDSIAVSFARKYGHHLWSQLSRLDAVDFIDTKRGTKMLCCGHIHKTSQARGKSICLSSLGLTHKRNYVHEDKGVLYIELEGPAECQQLPCSRTSERG